MAFSLRDPRNVNFSSSKTSKVPCCLCLLRIPNSAIKLGSYEVSCAGSGTSIVFSVHSFQKTIVLFCVCRSVFCHKSEYSEQSRVELSKL